MKEMEKYILKIIKTEIQERFNCEVVDISLVNIINTANVMVKIKYNDDFVYKPNEHFTIDSIVFSERSVRFFKRIDFFECVKKYAETN